MMDEADMKRQVATAYDRAFFAGNALLYLGPLALVFGLPDVFDLDHWSGFMLGAPLVFGSILLSIWLPGRLAQWAGQRKAQSLMKKKG